MKEFKIFLTAIMFYTRIPVGNIKGWSNDMLNKSTRYFPLIGYIVGGIGALVFWGASQLFPIHIAVILSIVGTIFLTGAFHEDGFADFCDGFGGGIGTEKILDIMKDSRLGTYGSIGLLSMLALKFTTLAQFGIDQIPLIIIAGHAASRIFPVMLIYTSEYVRLDETSKVKPIGKTDSTFSLVFALIVGGASFFLLPWQQSVVALAIMLLVFILFRAYVINRLGGYTGDVLGALQQLCEVFFYLAILGVQNLL